MPRTRMLGGERAGSQRRRAALWVGALAGVATLGAMLALTFAPAHARLVLDAYLLVLAALILIVLADLLARRYPLHHDHLHELLRQAPVPRWMPEDLQQAERSLMFSVSSASDLHHRLRPLLRDVAAQRLAVRRNVDLDLQPEQAASIVGPVAWDIIRPNRPEPDRHTPGMPLATLREAIANLEAI